MSNTTSLNIKKRVKTDDVLRSIFDDFRGVWKWCKTLFRVFGVSSWNYKKIRCEYWMVIARSTVPRNLTENNVLNFFFVPCEIKNSKCYKECMGPLELLQFLKDNATFGLHPKCWNFISFLWLFGVNLYLTWCLVYLRRNHVRNDELKSHANDIKCIQSHQQKSSRN